MMKKKMRRRKGKKKSEKDENKKKSERKIYMHLIKKNQGQIERDKGNILFGKLTYLENLLG